MNIQPADVDDTILGKRYGVLERGGKRLYRCRAGDHRIYFAIVDGNVRIHRILHKNSSRTSSTAATSLVAVKTRH